MRKPIPYAGKERGTRDRKWVDARLPITDGSRPLEALLIKELISTSKELTKLKAKKAELKQRLRKLRAGGPL